MENLTSFFEDLYKHFNERDIDAIITNMTENVVWANGMEGGFVYGQDGVKAYWTKQFTMVSANVTPIEIEVNKDNSTVSVKVYQVVHDLNGVLLSDEVVGHLFRFENGKIALFEIRSKRADGQKKETIQPV